MMKGSNLTGWSKSTATKKIQNLTKIHLKGDWRRFGEIGLQYRTATVTWTKLSDGEVFTMTSPVRVGTINLFEKQQDAQN